MRIGSTSRPLYVLQFGQTRCGRFGCLQVGQTCTRGDGDPMLRAALVAPRLGRLSLRDGHQRLTSIATGLARASGWARRLEEAAVVRDDDDRPLEAGERRLELLDRLEVEVVRGLVEHEQVHVARLELGEVGARPLAGRERRARRGGRGRRRARTSRAASARPRPQARPRRGTRRAAARLRRVRLACLPERAEGRARADARAGRPRAARSPSSIAEQRRLPAPVPAGHREPLARARGRGRSGRAGTSPRSATARSSARTRSLGRSAATSERRSSQGSKGFSGSSLRPSSRSAWRTFVWSACVARRSAPPVALPSESPFERASVRRFSRSSASVRRRSCASSKRAYAAARSASRRAS